MSARRIFAIAGRILRQFRHDPRTVALILVVPILVMALVGYLVGDAGKEPLPVAFVNADAPVAEGAPSIGSTLGAALALQTGIQAQPIQDPREAERRVRDGDAAGAILVPDGTSAAIIAGEPAQIRVIVGGIEPGLDDRVVGAVRLAMAEVASAAAAAGVATPQVSVERVPVAGGTDLSTLDYYAPALVVVFGFLFTFMLTSVAFLRERSSGTLERLMASPASRLDLLLGYLLGFIGFAMVQALVILGYAVWILGVHIAGPPWLVLLTLLILVVGVVNLGIALSFYARNELQAVQFIPLIFVPQIFLGGLFWPVQMLWTPLRLLSQVFPVTHAVVTLREVMVGGANVAEVAERLLALAAFAVAMLLLGLLALRSQRA
ncbi:MAG TPA: ABC transporter permease [Actinomycetota bacterium]|nr:ABC transporter permease [Actinomycetota bacterium]